MKKTWHDLIHSKHLGDLSLVIFINCSCIKKLFVNWKFPRFRSFRFWLWYKNRELSKLGNFSRLVVVLLEEVRYFLGFRVFDNDPYTKIENSKNSEIFSRLVVVFLEEVRNFRGFRVFGFSSLQKSKTQKTRKFFQDL